MLSFMVLQLLWATGMDILSPPMMPEGPEEKLVIDNGEGLMIPEEVGSSLTLVMQFKCSSSLAVLMSLEMWPASMFPGQFDLDSPL